MLAQDGAAAYGFSIWEDRWTSVTLQAPYTTGGGNVASAWATDGSRVYGYGGIGQLGTITEFPDFYRATTLGCLFRLEVSGEPSSPLIIGFSFAPASIPVPPYGTLLIDPSTLGILAQAAIPGERGLQPDHADSDRSELERSHALPSGRDHRPVRALPDELGLSDDLLRHPTMTASRFFSLCVIGIVVLGCCWALWAFAPPTDFSSAGGGDPAPCSKAAFDFESMAVGSTPAGFTPTFTGEGLPSAWTVTSDSSAPSGSKVLVQSSRDEVGFHFPLCINDTITAKDVALSVRFKTVGGRMNRSGGLVFRWQDKDHFYVTRFNSLEDNVNFYQYDQPGHRNLITGAYHLIITEEEWHTLRVEARGTHFKVWYDGKLQYELEDNGIQDAGKVGLWTKSDSVTYFDDFTVENFDEQK